VSYRRVGSGATLVFLHGIGGSSASWSTQQHALAARFDTIAWDAPGYGKSDFVPTPQVREVAQRLWALLDALQCAAPAHFVAQSLGAIVAAAACALQPARAATLTLLSPALGYSKASAEEREAKRAQRKKMVNELGMTTMANQRAAAMLAPHASPKNIAQVRETMAAIPQAGYLVATDLLAESDLREWLSQVRCPITIAAGRNDTITSHAQCQSLALEYRALFVTLGDAGHASYVDEPALVNALVGSVA
jgi:pimeloyl-ACP methyl ester carboxylesterase